MKHRFYGVGVATKEQTESYVANCHALGIPSIKGTGRVRLAVIGGGHSVKDHIQELRDFDGDRWIIASAFHWCQEQGIDGTFFSVCPQPKIAQLATGAKDAILASCSHPDVFTELKDAYVQYFDLVSEGDMMNHGVSAATSTFVQALLVGYTDITFYGCDSSYLDGQTTHAYEDARHPYELRVKANGEEFLTDPLLMLQAEYMAKMLSLPIKDALTGKPVQIFKEKSGGLLRALISDPDYDIVGGTPAVRDILYGKAA